MQVLASPFTVMKILSENFGYTVPVCPIEGGLAQCNGLQSGRRAGERGRGGEKDLYLYHSELEINIFPEFLRFSSRISRYYDVV